MNKRDPSKFLSSLGSFIVLLILGIRSNAMPFDASGSQQEKGFLQSSHATEMSAFTFSAEANEDTVFYESWESGIDNWYVENGVWEIGKSTAGPAKAYSGQNCAGTILGGNYPPNAKTRLISPQISLPQISTGETLQLKFFQWVEIYEGYSTWDKGRIQIKLGSETWVDIAGPFWRWSPAWTQVCLDVSAYHDQTIRIAFYFTSDNSRGDDGWFVDDISIVRGLSFFNNPEGFEQGPGDWSAEGGIWEVGKPTIGPTIAHSGHKCAGTILGGNYTSRDTSRLISPPVALPTILEEEKLQLKFWHWFRMGYNYNSKKWDDGSVQIKVGNENWKTIIGQYWGTSPVWTQVNFDVSGYAGKVVRFAFYFVSDESWEDNGWYIDDISITRETVEFNNPEDFERGVSDWSAENGLWEVGRATTGPPSAHSGQWCAGTVLGGNYTPQNNTRLISPEITLSPDKGITPELFFWHWFRIQSVKDKGYVQIKVAADVAWRSVAGPFSGISPVWTQYYVDLSSYKDKTVRIAFYFISDSGEEDNGWYIDDIRFPIFNNPPFVTQNIPDISFAEDTGPRMVVKELDLIFSDLDQGVVLNYKTYSDNQNIIPTIQNKSLILSSSQNYFGIGNVEVTAIDNGGKSVSDTFLVVITPVNDPPQIDLPAAITFQNDSYAMIRLWDYASDVETPDSLLAYQCSSDKDSLVVSYNQQTGEITLSAPGFAGLCWLYVSAMDDSNAAAFDTVRVTVEEVTNSVKDFAGRVPTQYELLQNYPNPFNSQTRICFALPKAEKTKLEVFNITGQRVATLVDGDLPAGNHEVVFDVGGLTSGVFYYRIKAGEFTAIKKLILIR